MPKKITKTDAEWQKELTPEEYRILRKKGTEMAFTGKLYHTIESGIYSCAACGNPLFKSTTKYDSGSGWPSFYDAIPNSTIINIDKSAGMIREEIKCAACDGHLGHRFNDGPNFTGMRYCVNSVSLNFKQEE